MGSNELARAFVKEAGHWCKADGTPAYEVPYAKSNPKHKLGLLKKTTLTDAKKLDLAPSVTSILNIMDKPACDRWKQEQVILAALTLPRQEDETSEAFAARIIEDAGRQAEEARNKGSAIHHAVETALAGEDPDEQYDDHVVGTLEVLSDIVGEEEMYKLNRETPFACYLGYGGKIDLWNRDLVIDLKTKEFDEDVDVKRKLVWPDNGMQLAAYGFGIAAGLLSDSSGPILPTRQINVYISRNNPGLVRWHEHTKTEIKASWERFLAALNLWFAMKEYRPSWSKEVA